MYPTELLEINDKSVKVYAFEPTGNAKFKYPTKEDIHDYPKYVTLLNKIQTPVHCDSRKSIFNFYEQELLKLLFERYFFTKLSFSNFVITPYFSKNLKI